jgi:hypothetical protein
MAFQKFANAELIDNITLGAWEKMHGHKAIGQKTAKQNFTRLAAAQSKYLLSHCTIMASVHCEDDPFDFLIRPEAAIYVNNNDDAWENTVLSLSYKSFVGAFNFLEHFQNRKANKGHIVDAILRKMYITPAVFIYYCDILVATDMAHEQLVTDIRAEKMKYMSMGCTTELVVCSFCGARCSDANTFCGHLLNQKGTFLVDDEGVPRRVAELCGHKSLPNGGVKFVEASWVGTPAFPGAANRGVVMDGWVGPKTPYTNITASRKVASINPKVSSAVDAKLEAQVRNLLG